MRFPGLRSLLLGSLALAAVTPAMATSYVPVSDETLVEQAAVVAVVGVLSGGPAAGQAPATEYRVAVERVLKGNPAEAVLVVRVPGGPGKDGVGLKIWGAPSFVLGERALLFLSPRTDGSWKILHLMLGAFHEARANGGRLAVRDLSEARPVSLSGKAVAEPVRDFDRFSDWIAARAGGLAPAADYAVTSAQPLPLPETSEKFSFLLALATPARWYEFDTGGSIAWRAHAGGQEGVAGGGFTQLQTAIAAWNDDPDTNVSYTYEGTTSATGGLTQQDGTNAILFNDPNGELGGFSCLDGGILAYGGPWYDESAPGTFRGEPYWRSIEADVVTNSGLACYFGANANPGKAAEELFAHELGHTLGLGHSCNGSFDCRTLAQRDALMYAGLHADGRGARLTADDRAGLYVSYTTVTYLPGVFFTVPPCRLLDTRLPRGPQGGPKLEADLPRIVAVAQRCGVPIHARAVSLNATVVDASAEGHLTLFPADAYPPSASTLNFGLGKARANNAVVGLASDGERTLAAQAFLLDYGAVHLILDVNGYFE